MQKSSAKKVPLQIVREHKAKLQDDLVRRMVSPMRRPACFRSPRHSGKLAVRKARPEIFQGGAQSFILNFGPGKFLPSAADSYD